jgi:probable F420-dependent oxidoreductase
MLTAYGAWDLARFSGGRFQLGLGTQIRANIEDRYAVPWSDPVGRMREYLEALGAIFASFQSGGPLRYEGAHYRFSRLQPYFNPGPIDVAPPDLWLGGVNEAICQLAGELADGFVTHPTNSNPRYLETICLPNLDKGAVRAGRTRRDLNLVVGSPYITGASVADVAVDRERQRHLLAFLYSTPAYRRTLELYGWAELGAQLQQLTRQQEWDRLEELVSDEVLDTLVPQGTYDELPDVIDRWFGDVATGVVLPPPPDPTHDAHLAEVIRAIQASRPADRRGSVDRRPPPGRLGSRQA